MVLGLILKIIDGYIMIVKILDLVWEGMCYVLECVVRFDDECFNIIEVWIRYVKVCIVVMEEVLMDLVEF